MRHLLRDGVAGPARGYACNLEGVSRIHRAGAFMIERAQDLGDGAVIDRVKGGDVAAFEVLMRRYNARLFRVARAITGDDDEAEDVLQEAYVRAWTRLAQFEGRS